MCHKEQAEMQRRSAASWLKFLVLRPAASVLFANIMAVDFTAAFFERVRDLELEAHIDRFKSIRWTTFAKLAFDTTYTPGGDEAVFLDEIIVKGLQDAAHPDKGLLRRLFCEAYTMSAGNLKDLVEGPNMDMPRPVPTAERLARRKQCAQALPGLELKGE